VEKKQKAFVKMYEKKYKSLPDNEKACFMDACHSTFNKHREAIIRFSQSASQKLRNAVRKYIHEKFHLFKQPAT
jgi:ribosomal protein S17E